MIYTELTNSLRRFGSGLNEILPGKVRHYFRPPNLEGFIVWAEDGEDNPFSANNSKCELQMHGEIDYYTKTEYDPVIDNINGYLIACDNVVFNYSVVAHEDETGLIHHNWDFWLV